MGYVRLVTEIGKLVKSRFLARPVAVSAAAIVVLGAIGLAVAGGPEADATHDATFKLREVSVFDVSKDDQVKGSFLRGQICRCQTEPFAGVRHYPAFVSKVPLYGSVKFGGRGDDTNSAVTYYLAVDESQGTGKGYDRLYFDGNRDLDLANDPVLNLQSTAPDHGYKPNFSSIKSVTCFDFLNLDASGSGSGGGHVQVMPRLLLTGDATNTYRFLFFVRTHFFEGDIKIAGEKFHACLGNDYVVAPDLNSPGAALQLTAPGKSFDWWGGDRISAMHKLGGHYYTFSASPDGSLTVHPYTGELGRFEIGAGGRALTNFSVSGSLDGRKGGVAVGGDLQSGRPVDAAACEIPVGDYLPEFLTVHYGHLRIQLSQNYHSEGKRQSREDRANVFGFPVRKDHSYALDFANQPAVMFASPTNSQRFKPGEEISVMAVLTDPKLDFMIRHLDDMARKQTKDENGRDLGYSRDWSLDPKVIITRINGEKVAEGVMPFG
jgi:hypothetical protein